MDFTIRTASELDVERLIAYVSELRAERLPTIFRDDAIPTVEEETRFIRQFAGDSADFFVAETDGRIVGNLGISVYDRPQTCHRASLGMSVLRPFRGRGIGSRLLDTPIDWCKSHSLRCLELEVLPVIPTKWSYAEIESYELACRIGQSPRGVVPATAECLTAAIDLGKYLNHWIVVAWSPGPFGHVVDYGRIEVASDDLGVEQASMVALRQFRNLVTQGWRIGVAGGAASIPKLVFVDSGYMADGEGIIDRNAYDTVANVPSCLVSKFTTKIAWIKNLVAYIVDCLACSIRSFQCGLGYYSHQKGLLVDNKNASWPLMVRNLRQCSTLEVKQLAQANSISILEEK